MAVVMIDIPSKSSKIPAVLRQAFRPFFLLGSVFGMVALSAWVGSFLGYFHFSPAGGALWWHGHEMLFGFSGAIIAGFLLTAVQNWTNSIGIRGWPLAGLVAIWLGARLLLAFPVFSYWPGLILDLAFFPAVATVLSRPVIRIRQWRNLVFLPILLALTLADAACHYALVSGDFSWFRRGIQAALLLVALLIAVIGGRVIPFFTARGTNTDNIPVWPWLERTVLGSSALVVALALLGAWQWYGGLPAAFITFIAGISHLLRQSRWRPMSTGKVPLLWSLHTTYACLVPGYFLAGAYSLGLLDSPSLMVHAFSVGALSGLILAMIARVSLGHSGRPLNPPRAMSLAFFAMSLAVLLRVIPPLFGLWNHWLVYVASAGCWLLAFGLYVWHYAAFLCQPRADGRMG